MRSLVIFDLDNTLVDRQAVFEDWLNGFVAEHHLTAADRAWLLALDDDGMAPRASFFPVVRERFELTASTDELLGAYWQHQVDRFRCPPATIDALRSLRRGGHPIGIATNGKAVQEDKIRAAGLDREVDAWCVSALVGSAKPDGRIFEMLAERCGASLEGAWVVGDRAEYDIAGAVAIGARSIWMRRGLAWPRMSFEPTFIVDAIAEIPGVIRWAEDATG